MESLCGVKWCIRYAEVEFPVCKYLDIITVKQAVKDAVFNKLAVSAAHRCNIVLPGRKPLYQRGGKIGIIHVYGSSVLFADGDNGIGAVFIYRICFIFQSCAACQPQQGNDISFLGAYGVDLCCVFLIKSGTELWNRLLRNGGRAQKMPGGKNGNGEQQTEGCCQYRDFSNKFMFHTIQLLFFQPRKQRAIDFRGRESVRGKRAAQQFLKLFLRKFMFHSHAPPNHASVPVLHAITCFLLFRLEHEG